MMIDVSVIICAYTEERWMDLLASVASIQKQTRQPCEIIVVIDHNRELFERVQTAIADAIVIESKEPRGLSGARNSGIGVSRGEFIAFLDDDAIAEPDWLEKLYYWCQYSHILGVGGIVIPLWSGKQPLWFPKEFYWVLGCTYQDVTKIPTKVRNPYGGCLCIRREVFEQVGGFRNGIGRIGANSMGGEETELCIRALQHWPNRVFVCEPRAKIYHSISDHRTTLCYFWLRCYAEGSSKALVSAFVGVSDSLASERIYLYKVLPYAIVSNLVNGLFHFDIGGLMRAFTIVFGLIITSVGYLVGVMSQTIFVRKRFVSRKDTSPHTALSLRNGFIGMPDE